MTFEDYLRSVLPRERFGRKADVKDLLGLLKSGHQLLITGEEQTGKTTLVRVLRQKGYKVLEPDEVLHIHLKKKIKPEDMIPNFYQNIE